MRRWMSLAKSVLMAREVVIAGSSSEDLRAIVVLGVEYPHEAQARSPVEIAGIKEDGRDVDAPLQLLKQRERPIDREEGPCPEDEDNILERIGLFRKSCGHEIHKRPVLGEDRVHGFDDGGDALLTFCFEPLLESSLRPHGVVKAFGQGDAL